MKLINGLIDDILRYVEEARTHKYTDYIIHRDLEQQISEYCEGRVEDSYQEGKEDGIRIARGYCESLN